MDMIVTPEAVARMDLYTLKVLANTCFFVYMSTVND